MSATLSSWRAESKVVQRIRRDLMTIGIHSTSTIYSEGEMVVMSKKDAGRLLNLIVSLRHQAIISKPIQP